MIIRSPPFLLPWAVHGDPVRALSVNPAHGVEGRGLTQEVRQREDITRLQSRARLEAPGDIPNHSCVLSPNSYLTFLDCPEAAGLG